MTHVWVSCSLQAWLTCCGHQRTLSVARLESASGTLFNVLRPADPASSQQHQQGGRPPSSVVQPTSPGFEPASRTPSRARARHRPRGRHSRRVNVDHSPISGTPSPSRGGGHASPRGVGVAKPSGGAGSGAGAGGGSAASSPRAPMRQLGSSSSTTSGSVRRAASQPAQPPRSPIHLHPESPPRRSTSHRPVLPLLHGFEHEGDGSRGSSPQSAASCRSAAARSSSAPAHRRSTGSRLARPTTAPAQSASQRKLQELRERMMVRGVVDVGTVPHQSSLLLVRAVGDSARVAPHTGTPAGFHIQ